MTGLAEAVALFRRGETKAARDAGERLLKKAPKDPHLLEFVGVMRCQTGDPDRGIQALRAAVAKRPGDPSVRYNLAQALTDLGRLKAAEAACAQAAGLADPGDRCARLYAYLLQALGRHGEAATAYAALAARHSQDAELHNNLGNARRAAGDFEGAVAALGEAAALRPGDPLIRLNLAAALAEAGRPEASLVEAEASMRMAPERPETAIQLARARARLGDEEGALRAIEASPVRGNAALELERGVALAALLRIDEAERAYLAAIALAPGLSAAWFQLGLLFEHGGRGQALPALIAEAERAQVPARDLALLRAFALRREGRIEAALVAAEESPAAQEPARRLQLIGEMNDRLGRSEAAFAAFEAMNRLAQDEAARAGARTYVEEVERTIAAVTPAWHAASSPPPPTQPGRPTPVFLVGFPRSGTTLLDTMLMGGPRLLVLEERPLWTPVLAAAGPVEGLAGLSAAQIERLRALYFEAVDVHAPEAAAGRLVVDKMPLNLARVPYIHRLFPDAKFILSLRHPADVVLSCFFTNFRLNYAMANFLDLGDAARLYDRVMTAWEASRATFGIAAHAVRYEDLIADPEAALQPLAAFLGLTWTPALADHSAAAQARGYVASASYAQVTEPIYRRAEGRWTRYRSQLAPVLPLLAPWIARYRYQA